MHAIVSREEAVDSSSMSTLALALESKKSELQRRRERVRALWALETAAEKEQRLKREEGQERPKNKGHQLSRWGQ